jgi:hypothetical protein
MTQPKFITIHGVRFCRDERTGYYRNGTRQLLAHRFAYETEHGVVPDGFHVHHKDGNRANNDLSNLLLMSASEHARHHGAERDDEWRAWARGNLATKARPKAAEWHRSKAGRTWHREHAKAVAAATPPRAFVCENCGTTYETKPFGANRFCSNACKSAYRRQSGVDNETRTCEACGTWFDVNRYAATRTCSRSCSNRMRARTLRGA